MGGWGSGGHNRMKGCITDFLRIDSFEYKRYVADIKQSNDEFHFEGSFGCVSNRTFTYILLFQDKLIVDYAYITETDAEDIQDTLYFDNVPNNYGGTDRIYFQCPYCRQRSRFLYRTYIYVPQMRRIELPQSADNEKLGLRGV